ncbi:chromosome segregation protein SMC [Altererythrobacter xixiisoli]|uniref:Chromosome partition protein Smc n=1 Tax=Croceibacterium xixiisoli TaxID=1476466 RepID=A0A6I4TZ93_9SPHN|nr:chromosome segregation protein SMC [Croceibacterium xixiisoli]MXO99693.1 chromosome segregation protein SMC [Croceibacterium xixiisoli]
MLIRKLKLSGFKSFVEPAELRIEQGLTGVVGPNGCGKSNLLEAIRWVMGENSPKSLRSGGMDDVIFAGTAQRPPRDFAEAVLHATDAEGEELVVTRRIERGAGSAYRVNGRDVRAKDVALVFADAATGAHSPALVSQGRIAAVIAAKPAERRMMLEEAAGIAGLHVRRRDAENKLRQTETNLARLTDLMAGLDSQMSTLRRQARQAERYRLLSEQIRTAEARLLFARWRDAAAAADAARAQAAQADSAVTTAQGAATSAQKAQAAGGERLAEARDVLADRRDDANAHGHRMAALTNQLEAAEQRLADLNRQQQRLEEDRNDADRMTRDAADALQRLEQDLAANQQALARDETQRPTVARQAEDGERAARSAELALAKATADHAGVEAEWRVAEAEVAQAQDRLNRILAEQARHDAARAALAQEGDPEIALTEASQAAEAAAGLLTERREALTSAQARKELLGRERDEAASTLAGARAELAGIEREFTALQRDRDARAKGAAGRQGMPVALDRVRAAPGYERALAAVLGRDAKSPIGQPSDQAEGRFWAGSPAPAPMPAPVADSLAQHVPECPNELAARLALVHVADSDDGRVLAPGEWLVTRAGHLRRWDGFLARGEGAAEAARLEADNRYNELAGQLPPLREAASQAEAAQLASQDALSMLQRELVGMERAVNEAAERERAALRAVDQAEAARERLAARREQLDAAGGDLAARQQQAGKELQAAQDRRGALPDPETGRAALDASRARHEAARTAMQAAMAALAAHDQALAVTRERVSAQQGDIKGWQARSGEAARRLSGMAQRFEEIAEERAVIEAKPAALQREIDGGEAVRERLARELAEADARLAEAGEIARAADAALAHATETLAAAREARALASARAENEDGRRRELAGISGERFQCPPPVLASKFAFAPADVKSATDESAIMDRQTADREKIGPVNLVAADELARIEELHGTSAAEQEELAEAVNRLRGSIGNLNREGRERLRAAFEAVDTHFRRLFTRLFEGGQAHLALVDSDDPLQAGLEIYAQPPGKRLQSLTLLSGGEQALTAVALIFALFLTNPAPICVLDEVDAPLDDANIDRFCDLLEAMARETQTRYLIVTHNAVTMSRMHRLFGVTMVERGVSRLVSVDLVGAEEILASAV